MVCIPCIVVPFILWFFHKYIQPYIQKLLPWSKQPTADENKTDDTKIHCNGLSKDPVSNGKAVTAGDGDGAGKADKKKD